MFPRMVEGQPAKLIFRSFYEPNYLMWAAVIAVLCSGGSIKNAGKRWSRSYEVLEVS